MEWDSLLPVIIGLLAFVGLPFALRNLKKGGPDKVEELHQHLQKIGIRVSSVEIDASQGKGAGKRKRSRGEKPIGIIKLKDKNIESVKVIGAATQYGVNYSLDFMVKSSSLTGRKDTKNTKMVRKKGAAIGGRAIEIEWKGDNSLSQKLNFDYRLKDKLAQADLKPIKNKISIHPEPQHGYTRIRTNYFLPEPDVFEIIDAIAKHTKSGW